MLKRDFGPDELKPLLSETEIDGVISVQARTDEKENDFLCSYAKENEFIKGVVGWVDLTKPEARESLVRFSELPKAVGVREVLQGMSDDAYCLREDFQSGDFIASRLRISLRRTDFPSSFAECDPVRRQTSQSGFCARSRCQAGHPVRKTGPGLGSEHEETC